MTEYELFRKLTVKTGRGDRDYHPDEVFRLLEIMRRMKHSLETIRWNIEATNPQAMIMKDEARKGLYGNDS